MLIVSISLCFTNSATAKFHIWSRELGNFFTKIERFTWCKDINQWKAEFSTCFKKFFLHSAIFHKVAGNLLGFCFGCGVFFCLLVWVFFRKQSLPIKLQKSQLIYKSLKRKNSSFIIFNLFTKYTHSWEGKKGGRSIENRRSCPLLAVLAHCFVTKLIRNSKGSYLEVGFLGLCLVFCLGGSWCLFCFFVCCCCFFNNMPRKISLLNLYCS